MNCPHCGQPVTKHRNPLLTVDVIIEVAGGIVLIERKNPPNGWALPGGFVDIGDTLEQAAVREAGEETSLPVTLITLLGCYSNPKRDPRGHTISAVYIAHTHGTPLAADDAAKVEIFSLDDLPSSLAFDHATILDDYRQYRQTGHVAPLRV